jgi:transcriptional regulator with XRE-family HTH domain
VADLLEARQEFGRRLREARVRRQYSQAQLAKMMDLDVHRYVRYELGQLEPPIGSIKLLCAMLGVSLSDLIGDLPQPPNRPSQD